MRWSPCCKGMRFAERWESADWLGVSVINVLEFLGFDGLSEDRPTTFYRIAATHYGGGLALWRCGFDGADH